MKRLEVLKTAFDRYCNVNSKTDTILRELFISRNFDAKEHVALEDEPARYFGFVCSGCLRMYNLTRDGKDLTKLFFLPDSFVVGAIHPDQTNTCSIQALTECSLLVADFQKLELLSKKNTCIHDFKMNLISEFVQMKQTRENRYLSLDASERYQLFLSDFPGLIDRIPHYHIASYLGITPTQLSRIRRK